MSTKGFKDSKRTDKCWNLFKSKYKFCINGKSNYFYLYLYCFTYFIFFSFISFSWYIRICLKIYLTSIIFLPLTQLFADLFATTPCNQSESVSLFLVPWKNPANVKTQLNYKLLNRYFPASNLPVPLKVSSWRYKWLSKHAVQN